MSTVRARASPPACRIRAAVCLVLSVQMSATATRQPGDSAAGRAGLSRCRGTDQARSRFASATTRSAVMPNFSKRTGAGALAPKVSIPTMAPFSPV